MQNVNATIAFEVRSPEGQILHSSHLDYAGLDEYKLLFIEKHLIAALAGMNAEAAASLRPAPPAV